MNKALQSFIRKELCPSGIWQLTDVIKSILRHQISRLPKSKVLEAETRYPTTLAGMRAFLDVFFTRHYFQVQHSLLDYMTSSEFLNLLVAGKLKILDVGCGPAVASLAITEMLARVLKYLKCIGAWPKGRLVKIAYVLNDISGICLGAGQHMLIDYFNISRRYNRDVVRGQAISIQKAFPDNMNQLRRIKLNLGVYDVATFSYVVSPLDEDKGFDNLVGGLLNIENLCRSDGRILILQDKFRAVLVRGLSRAIDVPTHKKELTQCVCPPRNTNKTYTYSYYRCLYKPAGNRIIQANNAA